MKWMVSMDVLQSGITIRHEFSQVGISSKQTSKSADELLYLDLLYIYIYIHTWLWYSIVITVFGSIYICGISWFYHSSVIDYSCDCVGERGLGQHRCFVGGNFCGEALLQRTETATRSVVLDLVSLQARCVHIRQVFLFLKLVCSRFRALSEISMVFN